MAPEEAGTRQLDECPNEKLSPPPLPSSPSLGKAAPSQSSSNPAISLRGSDGRAAQVPHGPGTTAPEPPSPPKEPPCFR